MAAYRVLVILYYIQKYGSQPIEQEKDRQEDHQNSQKIPVPFVEESQRKCHANSHRFRSPTPTEPSEVSILPPEEDSEEDRRK